MNLLELTEKVVEMANKDEKFNENIKQTQATIVMNLIDTKDTSLTFSINNGELKFSQGKPENFDFLFEISRKDFKELISRKNAEMMLMATKKLKMVEGSWTDIGKIVSTFGAIPKFSKEVVRSQ